MPRKSFGSDGVGPRAHHPFFSGTGSVPDGRQALEFKKYGGESLGSPRLFWGMGLSGGACVVVLEEAESCQPIIVYAHVTVCLRRCGYVN